MRPADNARKPSEQVGCERGRDESIGPHLFILFKAPSKQGGFFFKYQCKLNLWLVPVIGESSPNFRVRPKGVKIFSADDHRLQTPKANMDGTRMIACQ